jgi:glc operon protein GlcG
MTQMPLTETKEVLTYAGATLVLEAAIKHADDIGAPECIAVVDSGGNVLAFACMDGAATIAFEPPIQKARTAAAMGIKTGPFPFEFGVNLATASGGAITNLTGGLPLLIKGKVAGAIGVGSGTPEQDVAVAEAGAAAFAQALKA